MLLSPVFRERLTVFLMLFPTFLVIVGFYLYPTLYNLELSFTDMSLRTLRTGGNWVGGANYQQFVTSSTLWNIVFNTVVWLTAVSVALRLLLGLLFALLMHSRVLARLRLATLARLFLLVPWATPPVVAVIAWRWLFEPTYGPLNQLLVATGLVAEPVAFLSDLATVWPAVVTIVVWNTTPLVAISLLAALQAIPDDLNEAASLDGANRWQQFRFITLPYLMPTMSVLALMSTIWTFNNFVYVWLATNAGPGTFTNVLATEVYMKAFVDFRIGYSAAIGITMALVMAVFGAAFFRLFGVSELQEGIG